MSLFKNDDEENEPVIQRRLFEVTDTNSVGRDYIDLDTNERFNIKTVEFYNWRIEYETHQYHMKFRIWKLGNFPAEPDIEIDIDWCGCADVDGYIHFCGKDEPAMFWKYLYDLAEEMPKCDWKKQSANEEKTTT